MALNGKTALIAGAGGGLGSVISRTLAEAGASVALLGRTLERLEAARKALPPGAAEALTLACDFTIREQTDDAVRRVLAKHTSVDILIYAAGVNVSNRSIRSLSPADWDLVLATNLTGAFNVIRAVLPSMRERGDGLIIQLGSLAGIRANVVSGVAYSTAKFGQTALGMCISREERGPGVGPVAVRAHLAPYLPGSPLQTTDAAGSVSAAPFGSAGILPISWAYIALMGAEGLKRATQVAILNANYLVRQLAPHYPVLYTGRGGRVAHECILDIRPIKEATGISNEDIAKRLIDYGFHAPTMSFPVAGTLMIEPTESESKVELDRFVEAMIAIREEIRAIERGVRDRDDNALRNAPHTAQTCLAEHWAHDYTREQAAFPVLSIAANKYWPPVARVDNVHGDRHLVCSCPPVADYAEVTAT